MIQAVKPPTSPITSIEASIGAIASRQRRFAIFTAAVKSVSITLLVLLPLSVVAGLPWSRSLSFRIFTALLALAAVLAVSSALLRPVFRRRPLLSVAREIERQFPSIEERLSTALAPSPPAPLAPSPSLRAFVAREAADHLATLPVGQLVSARPLSIWLISLLALAIVWTAILSLPTSRRPFAIGLYRLSHPWQSRLPYSLADLTVVPGDLALLEGDTVQITATTSAPSASVSIQPDTAPRSSHPMQRTSPANWTATIEDVRESLRYRVRAGDEESAWYRVTITPRPALESLTIRYDFPAYTALPPKLVTALDAPIDALVGSRVTLNFRTSEPLDLRASRLVINSPSQSLALIAQDSNQYQTSLTVTQNASFSIDLVNQAGIHSRPQPPRRITARPDQIPSVVLQMLDYTINARPDDTIPIQFLASDDFAITDIECLVQFDANEAKSFPVPFDHSDVKHTSGPDFPLQLPDILASAPPDFPHDLIYQLRVTDNRSPNPQSALSARRQIHIDPQQVRSFQGQVDQSLGKTLSDIIASTINELDRAKPRLLQSKTRDGSEPLGEWQRHELHTAAHDLPDLATRLVRSAAQPADKTFVPITQAMSQIAQGPLRTAAEQSVRADLNADDWQQRNDAITQSVSAINTARQALHNLLDSNQIDQRRGLAEAARDLGAAHALQRASLDAIRHGDPVKAAEFQSRALKRLKQAIEESTALRDQPSQRLADQLQNLDRALRDLIGQPQPPDQRLREITDASTQAAASLQQAASALNLALATPAPSTPGAQANAISPDSATAGPPTRSPLAGPLPASIRDLGITPDQWLKLSPAAQRDVLSTSRQQGPPAYRPLIQDYYIKVSQMPAPNGERK